MNIKSVKEGLKRSGSHIRNSQLATTDQIEEDQVMEDLSEEI